MANTGDPWALDPIDDNNTAAPPFGAPEGWAFANVNDTERWHMACTAVLAQWALGLPVGTAAQTQAGTMALQNADAVAITGGTIAEDMLGGGPIGSMQPFDAALVSATYTNGNPVIGGVTYTQWFLCDGSTYTVPSGPLAGQVTTRDMRGATVFGAGANGVLGGQAGGSINPITSTPGGGHTHVLGNPTNTQQVSTQGGVLVGSNTHKHSVDTVPDHTHDTTPTLPPHFGIDWLVRLV